MKHRIAKNGLVHILSLTNHHLQVRIKLNHILVIVFFENVLLETFDGRLSLVSPGFGLVHLMNALDLMSQLEELFTDDFTIITLK